MLYDASLSHRAWYDYIYRFMARPFVGSELHYRLSGMMRVRHSFGQEGIIFMYSEGKIKEYGYLT